MKRSSKGVRFSNSHFSENSFHSHKKKTKVWLTLVLKYINKHTTALIFGTLAHETSVPLNFTHTFVLEHCFYLYFNQFTVFSFHHPMQTPKKTHKLCYNHRKLRLVVDMAKESKNTNCQRLKYSESFCTATSNDMQSTPLQSLIIQQQWLRKNFQLDRPVRDQTWQKIVLLLANNSPSFDPFLK